MTWMSIVANIAAVHGLQFFHGNQLFVQNKASASVRHSETFGLLSMTDYSCEKPYACTWPNIVIESARLSFGE